MEKFTLLSFILKIHFINELRPHKNNQLIVVDKKELHINFFLENKILFIYTYIHICI